jgi:hypothetical protein
MCWAQEEHVGRGKLGRVRDMVVASVMRVNVVETWSSITPQSDILGERHPIPLGLVVVACTSCGLSGCVTIYLTTVGARRRRRQGVSICGEIRGRRAFERYIE